MDHVVLDTNVLIMAISSRSSYHIVWQKFLDGDYVFCVTNEIIEEYCEVLARNINKYVSDAIVNAILSRKNVLRVDPHMHYQLITADPDDNKFVDCALFSNAKFIVSEDRHFDVLKQIPFPHVDVINIDQFVILLNSKQKGAVQPPKDIQ